MDRAGFAENLPTLDLVLLDTAEQSADVVARLGGVHELVEHFDTGDDGASLLIRETDDLDGVVHLQRAALDTTGSDGAAAGDREDVLDGHQERQVGFTVRGRDIVVDGVHQLLDASILGSVGILRRGLERLTGGAADDRNVVAREVVLVQKIADLHLNEVEKLGVVDDIGLVHEDDDRGNADLTGEQNVLAGLLQRAVGTGNDEDRAVHLGSTGDHVLHVVGVARAVDVRIVARRGLVLNVTGVDRDTSRLLFGGVVDLIVRHEVDRAVGQRKVFRDRGGQGGLTVVNVTDGTNVHMGFGSFKLLLCHFGFPP